jgi:hypothetical protein
MLQNDSLRPFKLDSRGSKVQSICLIPGGFVVPDHVLIHRSVQIAQRRIRSYRVAIRNLVETIASLTPASFRVLVTAGTVQ